MYTCFKNKIALITGGCSGIGKATALKFASHCARIIILDANEEKGCKTIQEITTAGGEGSFYRCDVSKENEVKAVMADIKEKFGYIDYAYNNAGIGGEFARVADYPVDDWHKVIAINLTGVFLCMKYEIPLLTIKGASAMVNCASLLSTVAYENDSAYVASKFGVLGLTKNAALEYSKSGLRINAISPGFTRTPMIDKGDETKLGLIAAKHPIGRLASPEEMAEGVLWLCSEAASFAIGLNLVLDGGYTLV